MVNQERTETGGSNPAWDVPAIARTHGYVRVAVVQLSYLPSALRDRTRSILEDPLFDLRHAERDALLPNGMAFSPESIRDEHKALRSRIRTAYVGHLRDKLEAVLMTVRRYGAELVVFPEYSIPPELLEWIATNWPELVVVAGTHAVDRVALKEKVYTRLQSPSEPSPLESVCPVLHQRKIIGVQAKLSRAKPEEGIMELGRAWDPIEVRFSGRSAQMGILICLDFLDPEAKPYQEYVAPKIESCDFVVVPSLTPHYTLDDFEARFRGNAKLHRRPVLYCNVATDGGSTIFIDDEHSRRARHYPEYIRAFDGGEEGVLIADIRLAHGGQGNSTTNPSSPLLHPVAAASFVYRSVADDARYADWLEMLGRTLLDGAVQAVQQAVVDGAGLLSSWARSGMRKHRLSLLCAEADNAFQLEWFRQLTREVVLPKHVLPWAVLQGALVRGAADVAYSWKQRTDVDLHEFGAVATFLQHAGTVKADALSPGGNEAVARIERAIRGDAPPARDPRITEATIRVYESFANDALDEAALEGRAAIKSFEYEKAESILRQALDHAERIVASNPSDEGVRKQAAWHRLHLAICVLNRQAIDEGRGLLSSVDAAFLPPSEQCTLARAWIELGDVERAKSVMPVDAGAFSTQDRENLRDIDQLLLLKSGELPTDLSPRLSVQAAAAELLLEREDYAGAAKYAIAIIEGAHDDAFSMANGLCMLSAALRWSIFEDPPHAAVIPEDARGGCISAMDTGLKNLQFEKLPVSVQKRVAYWRGSYWGIVFDVDAIKTELSTANRRGDGEAGPAQSEAAWRQAALELAQQGKLEEAFVLLPVDEHPWESRYLRVELMAIAGRMEMACETALELAREIPGKAPIEYQVGALLYEAHRFSEALSHAESAFRGLPGKGQRLLLARCLLELEKTQRAWDVLAPLRESRVSRIVLLLAQAADSVAQDVAAELWERYLASSPEVGNAKVRFAEALVRIGQRERASDIVRIVLKNPEGDLSPGAIFTAANIIHLHEGSNEVAREYVERAIELLHSRFPDDPSAEMSRMQLLLLVGAHEATAPVNYELLVQSGLVEAVPADEAIARLEGYREFAEDLISFYLRGGLPFSHLSANLTVTSAQRIVQGSSLSPFLLTPAKPASQDIRRLRTLEGQTLLLSDLEMLVLAHLGVLELLRERLDTEGRIVVYTDVRTRILQDAVNLMSQARVNARTPQGDVLGRAAQLADAVERFVARGIREQWIHCIERPDLTRRLPQLRGESTLALRAFVNAPLDELLSIRTSMEQNPSWLRVTADAWGSDYLAHQDTVQIFDWQSNERYLELSRWNRTLAHRDMHLPELARKLMTRQRLVDKLTTLTAMGFVDALGPEEIVDLARQPGSLEQPEVRRALDAMEQWLRGDQPSKALIQLAVAGTYGQTVWHAFCARPEKPSAGFAPVSAAQLQEEQYLLDIPNARSVARAMLQRAEAVDAHFRDRVISFAITRAAESPASFLKADSKGYAVNDPNSRGLAFYEFLYEEWALGHPERRAALGRAVVEVLRFIDEMRPVGPKSGEFAPFGPVTSLVRMGANGISLDGPEIETAAILSTFWKQDVLPRVLRDDRTEVVGGGIHELLAKGAAMLGHADEIGGNERTWRFSAEAGADLGAINVFAPVEAILLREGVNDDVRRRIAWEWSKYQGIHDGRAHEWLRRIYDQPSNRDIARNYARFSVTALWRFVRDDSSFFLQFADQAPFGTEGRLPRIEELRAMLSEPEDGVSDDSLVTDCLLRRVADDGDWSKLTYKRELFLQSAAVPGNTVLITLGTRLADDGFMQEVQDAYDRLSNPDEHPIAQLSGDFCFLQVAALQKSHVRLRQGELDLRHETPNLAVRLLESVSPKPTQWYSAEIPRKTLAMVEGAVLRVCKVSVQKIARRSTRLSTRNVLWLTYRLYQWLMAQLGRVSPGERQQGLERIASAAPLPTNHKIDLLDPTHFTSSLFDYRLATVLYTFALSDELARGMLKIPPRVSSAIIEGQLVRLVEGERKNIAVGTVLDWHASGEIPDLALVASLQADSRAILKISVQTRLGFLGRLPRSFEGGDNRNVDRVLAKLFVVAISDVSADLTHEERDALEVAARRMDDSEIGRYCKAFAFTGLFSKLAPHLEADARDYMIGHMATEVAPILIGRFLTSIALLEHERLSSEAERLVALLQDKGLAERLGLVVIGLARVALHGPVEVRTVGREVLIVLASRPEFANDPSVMALLAHVGVGGKRV